MDTSKIQLSADEMQLVNNSAWILTKHRIIEKVYLLFGHLSDQMQVYLAERREVLPPELFQLPPKISRGEQYESLPYVVLDYPRVFSKEDVFAIRSFFWWGHYFSVTLHLKGKFRVQYQQAVSAAIAAKKLEGIYLSDAGSEFSFNLDGKNFLQPEKVQATGYAVPEQASFLKISYKLSFDHWAGAEPALLQFFQQCISAITA